MYSPRGLPERFHPAPVLVSIKPKGREQELDAFFGAIPSELQDQGDEACYEAVIHRVTMPPSYLFSEFDRYYATLADELPPWTGTPTESGAI